MQRPSLAKPDLHWKQYYYPLFEEQEKQRELVQLLFANGYIVNLFWYDEIKSLL